MNYFLIRKEPERQFVFEMIVKYIFSGVQDVVKKAASLDEVFIHKVGWKGEIIGVCSVVLVDVPMSDLLDGDYVEN